MKQATTHLRMLDTAMAAEAIRGTCPVVATWLQEVPPECLCISAITRAELQFGAGEGDGAVVAGRVAQFLSIIKTLPWAEDAADVYVSLILALHRTGRSAGDKDVAIAAHAMAAGATLVTEHPEAFAMIADGISYEDWRTR